MGNRIYLVTGAAGFLGSNICVQLLEKGEKVRALVLPNDPTKVVGAYSQSKAKEELGYTTRSYKETIHDEVEWLKQEGLI